MTAEQIQQIKEKYKNPLYFYAGRKASGNKRANQTK